MINGEVRYYIYRYVIIYIYVYNLKGSLCILWNVEKDGIKMNVIS